MHKVELPTGGKQAQVASWKKGPQIVEKKRERERGKGKPNWIIMIVQTRFWVLKQTVRCVSVCVFAAVS